MGYIIGHRFDYQLGYPKTASSRGRSFSVMLALVPKLKESVVMKAI